MWLGEQEGEEQQWAAMPVWDLPKAGTVRKVKAKYLRKGGNATSGLLLTCLSFGGAWSWGSPWPPTLFILQPWLSGTCLPLEQES